MKKITVFLFLICIAIPTIAHADKFRIGNRTVGLTYKQSGNRLIVKGHISGRRACNQLNVDIFFDNNRESNTAHVETAIKNYKPSGRGFKVKDRVYSKKIYRKGWYVGNIYLNCL